MRSSLKYLMRRRLSRGLTSLRGRAGEEAKACLAIKTNGVPEGAMLEFAISVYMMVQASPEDRALYIFSILDTNGNKQASSVGSIVPTAVLLLSPRLLEQGFGKKLWERPGVGVGDGTLVFFVGVVLGCFMCSVVANAAAAGCAPALLDQRQFFTLCCPPDLVVLFDGRCLMFNVRCSTFNVRSWTGRSYRRPFSCT